MTSSCHLEIGWVFVDCKVSDEESEARNQNRNLESGFGICWIAMGEIRDERNAFISRFTTLTPPNDNAPRAKASLRTCPIEYFEAGFAFNAH